MDDLSPMREGAGPKLWRGTEEVDVPETTRRARPDLAPVRLADEVVVGKVSVAVGKGLARSGIGEGKRIEGFKDDHEGVGGDDLGRGEAPFRIQSRIGKAERPILFRLFAAVFS